MLTYLLLASVDGRPLEPEVIAELDRVPARVMAHRPETAARWLAKGDHVAAAAWQTRPGVHGGTHWHIGGHGLTLASGTPWPTARPWSAPSGWAFELTDRIDRDLAGTAVDLAGSWTLARIETDGAGIVTAGPLGGGAVWVRREAGVLVVSNRAGVAAGALGATPGRAGPPATISLVSAGSIGHHAPYAGLRRLEPGEVLHLSPEGSGAIVDEGPGWRRAPDVDRAAEQIRAAVASAAATSAVARMVDLSAEPGARVLAAAIAATGTADRFRFRVSGDEADAAAAHHLADLLGVHLETDHEEDAPDQVDALATWVRQRVARTEGTVATDQLAGVRASDGALVVRGTYGDAFLPSPDRADSLLHVDARPSAAAIDGGRLRHELPLRADAEGLVLGAALRIDPLQHPDVASLAASAGEEGLEALLRDLAPTVASAGLPVRSEATDRPPWRAFAPTVEALASSAATSHGVLDDTTLRRALRGDEPDAATRRSLWGVLTAAVWGGDSESTWQVQRRSVRAATTPAPTEVTTLVTGLTSRSLIDLAGLRLTLDEQVTDPLLATQVDGRLADLCERLLLAVDAAPAARPADLATRLAARELAGFADLARALTARRGGVLADPRLGLTLPFWREHLGGPLRIVLITERPAELVARSPSPLPPEHLLSRWIDVVLATLTQPIEVRVLDPRDVADIDGPEGIAPPDAVADSPTLQLATVVDSLVRELDGESMRPILAALDQSRSDGRDPASEPQGIATGAPLRVVDELWRDVVAVDRLRSRAEGAEAAAEAEVQRLRRELAELRSLRSVRLAERMFGRRPPASTADGGI